MHDKGVVRRVSHVHVREGEQSVNEIGKEKRTNKVTVTGNI
jgi:hypothetical protein